MRSARHLCQTFLSTPSARRATYQTELDKLRKQNFYPRPPRGGRRCGCGQQDICTKHFYPRPPRGGRLFPPSEGWKNELFLSTPSARRATVPAQRRQVPPEYFYPRPPRGGRRYAIRTDMQDILFLSTPSARRATLLSRSTWCSMAISIHALREEGDSAEGAQRQAGPISIHALREEGDVDRPAKALCRYDFYPRPPRGGRLNAALKGE